jgi:hypothetical protein
MSQKLIPAIGISVIKSAQNLPQTATATLFTVSGGAVLVTALFGKVTTACGATVTTLTLGDSVGGAATIATATAITSAAAGTLLAPNPSAGAAGALLVKTVPFVSYVPLAISPFLLAANVTWTTNANDTGQVAWYLWYMPIDFDASVS